MILNLEPSMVANLDQAYHAAKDYTEDLKKEFNLFREKHPELTKTECHYILFDSLQKVMGVEQSLMAYTVSVIDSLDD